MAIRVATTPKLVPKLVEFLASRPDTVVARVATDVIAVSLLGSIRADEQRDELEDRLRAWESSGRGVRAVLVPDVT